MEKEESNWPRDCGDVVDAKCMCGAWKRWHEKQTRGILDWSIVYEDDDDDDGIPVDGSGPTSLFGFFPHKHNIALNHLNGKAYTIFLLSTHLLSPPNDNNIPSCLEWAQK